MHPDPVGQLVGQAKRWFDDKTADDRKILEEAEEKASAIPIWRRPWRAIPWAWSILDWGDRIALSVVAIIASFFVVATVISPHDDSRAFAVTLAVVSFAAITLRLRSEAGRIRSFCGYMRKRTAGWPKTDDEKVVAYLREAMVGGPRMVSVDDLFGEALSRLEAMETQGGESNASQAAKSSLREWRAEVLVDVIKVNLVIWRIDAAHSRARNVIDGWPSMPPPDRARVAADFLALLALAGEAERLIPLDRTRWRDVGGLSSFADSEAWSAFSVKVSEHNLFS
jgi:hypothetical protein